MDGAASSTRFHPRASLGSMNCEVVTCNGEPHIGRFSYTPVTEELSIRAQLLEEGGPAMWNQFMSELAHAHHGHQRIAIFGDGIDDRLRYTTGLAGFRSIVKSVPNRLRITPSNAFSRTSRPAEKTVNGYALYLTVFWFPSVCTSEKTVKNTVKLSCYRRVKILGASQIIFLVQ
jgi:hypothetical protein